MQSRRGRARDALDEQRDAKERKKGEIVCVDRGETK